MPFTLDFSLTHGKWKNDMEQWIKLIMHVSQDYGSFQDYRRIVENLLHNFYLVHFNLWQQQHGNQRMERVLKHPEQLCMKFYNLTFDHFLEQRETKF